MKTPIWFIAGLVVLPAIFMLSCGKPLRRFDERITLRQHDQIPYGTAVARHLLPAIFPAARIGTGTNYPSGWDLIQSSRSNQAVILVADFFNADEQELNRLSHFVEKGNYVFLIARTFSVSASRFLQITVGSYYNVFAAGKDDTLQLRLEPSFFSKTGPFSYPGKRHEGHVYHYDSTRTLRLGNNGSGGTNFVQINRGRGRFFVHTAPLAFSNYFILHRNNIGYYQQALSVIPKNVSAVVWNEYFLVKNRDTGKNDPAWLATLFKFPAFRWGFLTALFFLVVYVLLSMRRRQRVIPLHEKPKNDSLDFVKTLGRLYFDKGDHRNLAEKMGVYFLEYVRATYHMATHTLDAGFIKQLHTKSGYPETDLSAIVAEIEWLRKGGIVTQEQLAYFHHQLERFYQNT